MLEKESIESPRSPFKSHKPLPTYVIYLAIGILSATIVGGGCWLYYNEQYQMQQQAERELSSIAQLKMNDIVEWRAERLADAEMILNSPFFIEGIAEFIDSPEDIELKNKITSRLKAIETKYTYHNVMLVDLNGKVLIKINELEGYQQNFIAAQVQAAAKENKVVFIDFHSLQGDGLPHLDVIVPLVTKQEDSQRATGAVILAIDPALYLYPLLQSWPVPSDTAETLLVERDGEDVIYLNELRHQKDTALRLRIPLSQTDVPAVMVVSGKQGIVRGRDYHGEKVLAFLQPIPNSPWHMVAKMDESEALVAWHTREVLIIALVVVLLTAGLGITGLAWQRKQRLAYEALYRSERSRKALASHFEYLVKYANDIIILADENKRIVEVNDRALEAYGYTHEEMLNISLGWLVAPNDLVSFQVRMNAIAEKGQVRAEALHKRKDGSIFPVEISARAIIVEGRQFIQTINRDITRRKEMENHLKQANRLYAFLSEINQMLVRTNKRDVLFQSTCRIAMEHGKFRMAWIGILDESRSNITRVAKYGDETDFPPACFPMKGEPYIHGPICEAVNSGKVSITNDVKDIDLFWRGEALQSGIRSIAAVPIKQRGEVIGSLSLYADAPDIFSEEEQKLLSEIGNDLSYALEAMEAEEKLRGSELRYRTLFETMIQGVVYQDASGKIISANPAAERILGLTLDQMQGCTSMGPHWKAIHEDGTGFPGETHPSMIALKTGKPVRNVIMGVFNPVTQKHHWININAIPQFKPGENQPYQVYTTFEDITEQKVAKEQILRSKTLLQTVIDSTPDRVAAKDSQHRYLLVNKSLANSFNLKPADMIGKYDTEFYNQDQIYGNPEKGTRSIRKDDNAALEGKIVRGISRMEDKATGEVEIFDAYRVPLRDPSGNIYGILAYSREITEQIKAADELEQSYKKLQKTLDETVDAIGRLCETRDPYTAGHQSRVNALASAIGSEMGLSGTTLANIRTGSILHDTGKMYVPAEILSKPGKLTEIEYALIKNHPEIGYDILKRIDFPNSVATMVLQHHERLDGSGYPKGLKGDEIIIESKILAVADVVEAMSSFRPYRPALGVDKALDEITKNKGILYDESVVDACVRLFNEKQFTFE